MTAPHLADPDAIALAAAAQAEAAEPTASAWVAANAGSGKTKVLIDRVARLLLRPGVEPDQILCVTYTKAAATEMQDRLFERLGDWCVMDRESLARDLARLEGRADFTDTEIGRARELFASALETPGGLRIETIHAFCGRVLRRFPLEAGVAPGFRELDEDDADDLWEDAVRALGARVGREASGLREAARVAAEAGGSDLGILRALHAKRASVEAFIDKAGGIEPAIDAMQAIIGAGDLSVAELIERGMGPELPREELKRAAGLFRSGGKSDLKQADCIDIALSDAPDEDRLRALCSVPFTAEGAPRDRVFTNALRAGAPLLVALFDTDFPQGSETLRLAGLMEACAARRAFERSAALLRLADWVFADFRRRKQASAGLDFDDLIQSVAGLLTRSRAAEWVLWKLDGGVAHLLLDEAQDTSPDQWRILRALTDDIFAGVGVERATKRTMFVVGDQKQSIYSFQGADPEHFLREGRELRSRSETTDVRLNTPSLAMSFRSVRQVLDFVDDVFDPAHLPDGAPLSLEAPDELDYVRHVAHRAEQPGLVEFWPLQPPPETEEPDPWDAPRDQVRETSPKAQLAKRIAAFVRREIDQGARVWEKGQARAARPGDFLILVKGRTGGLFDGILQALKAARLPVAGADRIQLLDSLAVQDVLNLARFALCPEDDLTLAEALKGPFVGLDDDDLLELAWSRPGDLWSRLQSATSERHAAAHGFLADLLARRHLPPYEFFARTLDCAWGGRTGWERLLSRLGDPAREPVTALIDRAAAYDASAPPSLELFVAAIEHHGGEVKRELSGADDAVRVMTVHGAKGLQAPIVILPDTTSAPKYDLGGLFLSEEGCPIWVGARDGDTSLTTSMRAEARARSLKEHRRLLYVALTRAQDRLVICGAWNGRKKTGRDDESWYALCGAGMARLREAGLATEVEDPAGPILRLGEAPPALGSGTDGRREPGLPDWIAATAPAEPDVQRVLAPSSLGGLEPPPLAPFGPGRAKRLRRGRLIHALFEHLPDLAPERRAEAGRAFLARQPDLKPAEHAEMLAAALRTIEDPVFAQVFAPGGRGEAAVVGRLGADLINGRVDRLVVTPHEILIVDYKTDRPAPADVAEVGRAYVAQLAAYRRILGRTWSNRPVRCLLVWTDGPKLMEIPAEQLDAALAAALP